MEDFVKSMGEKINKGIAKAKEFRNKYPSTFVNYGVDLNEIAKKHSDSLGKNIDIREVDMSKLPNTSGFTLVRKNDIYIAVNKNEPLFRQRFTIAHELGHIYLEDININDVNKVSVFFRSDHLDLTHNPDRLLKEQEANSFASELLMPEEQVMELIFQEVDVDKMAVLFGVSKQAMKIRVVEVIRCAV